MVITYNLILQVKARPISQLLKIEKVIYPLGIGGAVAQWIQSLLIGRDIMKDLDTI